ncbi:MAG: hypothetical protein JNL59_06385 [Chitinophagaceae bacterium]|nr:hypothetical protein [Chitinophagaceae bacterium]
MRAGQYPFPDQLASHVPIFLSFRRGPVCTDENTQRNGDRIEGHVNLPPQYDSTDGFGQRLSDERARAVYDYLVSCGIEKERMSTIGHSNRFLLYRHAPTIEQQTKNRRVEINVISLEDSLNTTR